MMEDFENELCFKKQRDWRVSVFLLVTSGEKCEEKCVVESDLIQE